MKTTGVVFEETLEELGFAGHKPNEMSNSDYWMCTNEAMKKYAIYVAEDLRERIAEEAKTKSGVTFGHRNGRLEKEIIRVVDKDSIRTIEINLP